MSTTVYHVEVSHSYQKLAFHLDKFRYFLSEKLKTRVYALSYICMCLSIHEVQTTVTDT